MNLDMLFKEYVEFDNIREIMNYCVKNYPDNAAYCFTENGETVKRTFKENFDDVNAVTNMFLGKGFAGKKIAVVGPASYPMLITVFAAMNAGAVLVPLDKAMEDEELAEKVAFSDSEILIYDKEYAGVKDLCGENISALPMAEVAEGMANDEYRKSAPENQINSDDVAMLCFTSGTTSVGKAVMLSHRNLLSSASVGGTSKDFINGTTILLAPLNHLYGICQLFWAQYAGCCVVIDENVRNFTKNMQVYKPTVMMIVPQIIDMIYGNINKKLEEKGSVKSFTAMRKVFRTLAKCGIDVRGKVFGKMTSAIFGGNLGTLNVGGAALDPVKVTFFGDVGIDVLQGYGLTETATTITALSSKCRKLGSVGVVMPFNEVRIKDGEIQVKGRNVMKGYYKNEEATREAFDGEWLKTGDMGRIDEDGFVFITGRVKNVIILSNGENVSPEALEDKIEKIDVVCEVLVKESDGKLCAEVFMNENGMSREEAEKHLRDEITALNRTLPSHHNIAKVEVRDTQFERTALGKIKRNQA